MIGAQTVEPLHIVIIVIYLMVIGYLGWLGYRRTKTAADYMVAGRQVHPFIMAMSYGATFISTSAIVGFGGVAGVFGMSLLWLTFCNIFVGIFIAFVVFGGPTRRLGHRLNAHTFPELLGKRYQSTFVQVFSGLVIFLFIPLYAAAVMIGGCEFIHVKFGIGYDVALLIFAVLIAAYVVVGGLKGVMYTDALQGTIMFVGMVILLIYTYVRVGGFVEGHQHLTDLAGLVPGSMRAQGHQGWTSMPTFGWGSSEYNYWWIVVSTIVLGVGIGVLAQPQLVVRFMTVKSKKELNRAVLVGGIFILTMTGVAFVVGSLSNSYFTQHGKPYTGRVIKTIDEQKGQAVIQLVKRTDDGEYEGLTKPDGSPLAAPVVLDKDQPYLREVPLAGGGTFQLAQGRSISIVYAKGNAGKVIPMFLERAMPEWFSLVFLLTLLAAAMSTLSSQFHAVGTSIGRDIYESTSPSSTEERSILITRIGIILGIVIAVLISYSARESTFIARATAIFFGLCASAFLPAFVGGLFWRKATKAGAIASILVGFGVSAFWLVLVKAKEAETIGLVQKLTEGGKPSILADAPNWPVVDPLLVALPLSGVTFLAISLMTRSPGEEHLSKCFKGSQPSTDK